MVSLEAYQAAAADLDPERQQQPCPTSTQQLGVSSALCTCCQKQIAQHSGIRTDKHQRSHNHLCQQPGSFGKGKHTRTAATQQAVADGLIDATDCIQPSSSVYIASQAEHCSTSVQTVLLSKSRSNYQHVSPVVLQQDCWVRPLLGHPGDATHHPVLFALIYACTTSASSPKTRGCVAELQIQLHMQDASVGTCCATWHRRHNTAAAMPRQSRRGRERHHASSSRLRPWPRRCARMAFQPTNPGTLRMIGGRSSTATSTHTPAPSPAT